MLGEKASDFRTLGIGTKLITNSSGHLVHSIFDNDSQWKIHKNVPADVIASYVIRF